MKSPGGGVRGPSEVLIGGGAVLAVRGRPGKEVVESVDCFPGNIAPIREPTLPRLASAVPALTTLRSGLVLGLELFGCRVCVWNLSFSLPTGDGDRLVDSWKDASRLGDVGRGEDLTAVAESVDAPSGCVSSAPLLGIICECTNGEEVVR